jgi:hypothetical protein
MRYSVPSSGSSQQIINSPGQVSQVILQNVSAVLVYVGDNQANLDSSLDSSGTPTYGFILFPNQNPITIDKFSGVLYARGAVGGGAIEATQNPVC